MNEKINLDQFAQNNGLKKIDNQKPNHEVLPKVVSSKIFYLDEEKNIVSKENATNIIIVQYDSDGNRVNEIYGSCNKKTK